MEEGHSLMDRVHVLFSIPPKHAMAHVVGFIKGKSAVHVARLDGERKRNFVGALLGSRAPRNRTSPWARGAGRRDPLSPGS